MSIINDALKKTQERLNPAPSSLNPASTPSEPKWLNGIAAIIFSGLVVCAVAAFFLIARKDTLPIKAEFKKPPTLSPAELRELDQTLSGTPVKKRVFEKLILNGIIANQDGNLALINNKIFKAGDYVNGKKVLQISEDWVQLEEAGEIQTLMTEE